MRKILLMGITLHCDLQGTWANRRLCLLSRAVERIGCAVQVLNDPRQPRPPLLEFPRRQVAWLSKLTVNPLLDSAGRHTHEIRLRLADRNGIADLEFPFPQPRLYLGKAEFNTPAVHV